MPPCSAARRISPLVVALAALALFQQAYILRARRMTGFGGAGVDNVGRASPWLKSMLANTGISSSSGSSGKATGTGTPPRYTGDPRTSTVLFFFCPGGNDETVRFVEQAVMSGRAAGFRREDVVIIDTSHNTHCYYHSEFVRREVGYVHPTNPTDLTFSMLQNTAWRLAQRWGFPYYFWQHADVVITDVGENETFASKAVRLVNEGVPDDWAVVHFAYDLVTAFKTEAVARVRWDQAINHYPGDCDFYIRVQFAGYQILKRFAGIALHIKNLLPQPILAIERHSMGWYKERGAFEPAHMVKIRTQYSTNPNASNEMVTERDIKGVQVGLGVRDDSTNATATRYRLESDASMEYYLLKWGPTTGCKRLPHQIGLIGPQYPAFDINDASKLHRHEFSRVRQKAEVKLRLNVKAGASSIKVKKKQTRHVSNL